jgi:beta-1,4-mannosyl-glycoprotein beta-1,4-N-acetylglucosaminyltransferase
MKIYDCFTFYNELDLLELRLQELYDHVDHFVLVEANRTFQNNSKPFYFGENQHRFARYMDKIIHIQVNDMPESTDAWGREAHQRICDLRRLRRSNSKQSRISGKGWQSKNHPSD